jgi:hypothetical protein
VGAGQHCPWNEFTCAYAAVGGHLEVLQWAREHDCPWNDLACAYAAQNGHLAVLQWARERGCPWRKHDCERFAQGHPETLAWVQEQPQ